MSSTAWCAMALPPEFVHLEEVVHLEEFVHPEEFSPGVRHAQRRRDALLGQRVIAREVVRDEFPQSL